MIVNWPRHIRYRCAPGCRSCEIDACPTQVLFSCSTCGASEAELATDCPGYRLPAEERAAVQNGHLNFRDGKWRPENVVYAPQRRRR